MTKKESSNKNCIVVFLTEKFVFFLRISFIFFFFHDYYLIYDLVTML